MNRRGFLTGIVAACAAPAIVRSGLIMPIRPALAMPDKPVTLEIVDKIYAAVMAQNERANTQLLKDFITHGMCVYRQFGAVRHRIAPERLQHIENRDGLIVRGVEPVTHPYKFTT